MTRSWKLAGVAAVLVICTVTACAGPVTSLKSPPEAAIFWPQKPLQPRVQWVRSVQNAAEAGIANSFWRNTLDFLSGADQRHILRPYGVLLDRKERLFVADPGGGVVHLFDLKAQQYSVLSDGANGRLRTPIGLTEDGKDRLYISDSTSGEITRYDIATGAVSSFQVPMLSRPTGIAFNRLNQLIYIVDTLADEVLAVDQDGVEKIRFGSSFNHPTDICVDGKGQVYVTDPLNHRIKIFTPEGTLVNEIGSAGEELGRFNKPKGVAVDSEGHIYVADSMHDSVQVFDSEGRYLLSFGSTGTGKGEFWMPSGMYMDHQDYLVVADTYNRRVQLFRYLPQVEGGGIRPGAAAPGLK